jgi:hypothetical protein
MAKQQAFSTVKQKFFMGSLKEIQCVNSRSVQQEDSHAIAVPQ